MYQKICIKTAEVILSVLVSETEIKDNAICHPQKYYSTIHRLLSGVLGIVSNHNLNGSSSSNARELFQHLESKLSSDCVFVENSKNSSNSEIEALNVFLTWFQSQGFEMVDLSDLYELMLSLEFPIETGTIVKDFENEIPDTIGSFYTPKDLADICVALTIDNYIFQNTGIERFSNRENSQSEMNQVSELLMKSSYADYSVGTGSFIQAILRYVDAHISDNPEKIKEFILLNFKAMEADSLALEIAKIELLRSIDRLDLYSELSTNFTHGNPLLKPIETNTEFTFGDEFYYHNGLAIDPARLTKSDVTLGNPPWGEVGFDLAYFCRVILPKVNDLESQDELESVLGNLESSHPFLFDWLLEHEEANDLAVDEIYEDERFQHSTNGGLQTNVLFTELLNDLTSEKGSTGLILKGSTLSDKQNQGLVEKLKSLKGIVSRYDFSNTNKIFNIDPEEDFSILILGNPNKIETTHQQGLTSLNQLIN